MLVVQAQSAMATWNLTLEVQLAGLLRLHHVHRARLGRLDRLGHLARQGRRVLPPAPARLRPMQQGVHG